MDYIEEELEEMASSAEEQENLEEETEEDEVENDSGNDEDEGDDVQESRHDGDNDKEEVLPQTSEKKGENKQCEGLNVNNEVVKMRKEVKRVRVLIIRKLTRQIGTLRKKKGKETEIERNQRRTSRLLEEIHAMKFLSPDLVTKTALQKNLNFEQVCKNPRSTISDRALARIATHPQFNQKIEGIKAAVKSFKDERTKSGKQVGKDKVQNNAGKGNLQPLDKKKEKGNEKKDNVILEAKKKIQNQEGGDIFKETAVFTESEKERGNTSNTSIVTSVCQRKETSQPSNVKPAKTESSNEVVKNTPQPKGATTKPAPEAFLSKKEEEESDLESSDDEDKQYFDDSTEERFHKQSSESGESESEDDFFIGKVSKYGKKKRKVTEREKGHEVKADPAVEVQSKQDELESKPKLNSLQSIFCSSLAGSKPGAGRGAGRGRGGDKFRSQGKPKGGSGMQRDFGKQSRFQKQEKGTGKHSLNPKTDWSKKPFSSDSRGAGRGRGIAISQKPQRGGGLFSEQKPQQALHPSWEASKKRKEQQGQILAFQGKKIKFDEDD